MESHERVAGTIVTGFGCLWLSVFLIGLATSLAVLVELVFGCVWLFQQIT